MTVIADLAELLRRWWSVRRTASGRF